MLRSTVIRLGESVLVAQYAIQQLLEIWTGQPMRFTDLKITPGEIITEPGNHESLRDIMFSRRRMYIEGVAHSVYPSTSDASFEIVITDLSLIKGLSQGWQVCHNNRMSVMIEKRGHGKSWCTAYWNMRNDPVTVHIIDEKITPEKPGMWIIGSSLADRREEPFLLNQI